MRTHILFYQPSVQNSATKAGGVHQNQSVSPVSEALEERRKHLQRATAHGPVYQNSASLSSAL